MRALWRGQVALPLTYWVFGVGGNMAFVAALLGVWLAAGPAAEASLWGLYLASLAWFVWIFIGIWRSAGRYGGPRLWAVLARAGVCAGIFRMAGEAILIRIATGAA